MKICQGLWILFAVGLGCSATVDAQEPKPGEQVDCVFEYGEGDNKQQLKYDLFVPANYDDKDKLPLMLFLHGAGERGDDLNQVRKWGPAKLVKEHKKFPFIVVSPQCPRDTFWPDHTKALALLVDELAGKLKVDNRKMYCTGLSMGGYGTWAMCARYPKLFAAAAPICGKGDPKTAEKMTHIPIWAFHGDADRVVKPSGSRDMVAAIKEAGGKEIKYTEYKGVGHNSWSETYANKELYGWMLSKTRGE